ncbi:butyrate kinase [Enterococcus cecorum]|uniref:butyrate kinase n=1 Tax=Enterococcus cecorum TaxID=44008 RepID=UPI002ACA62AA|nr:butyrate kinase [Enterococcus cecorum]MDZ5584726.1 butyrate kinase [Enterococcus cecorum]
MYKVLVINPGSTSTKVAYYENEKEILKENVFHPSEDLQVFEQIIEQYDYRFALIRNFLDEAGIDYSNLDAVVGRGGSLPPVQAGAYEVNEKMIDWLINKTDIQHASNLGALLAEGFKQQSKQGCIAMIYDPITVDQFHDLARISGLKGVQRRSIGHMLNMRAVAMKAAHDLGKSYEETNLIVAHLGSGSTISVHQKGRMIDLCMDDEGPFSVERSGGLCLKEIVPLCYELPKEEMISWIRKKGGMISYLGTNSGIEVEERILHNDSKAKLIFEAMAYQVAKGIGELATVLKGNVDQIVITGGMAHSDLLVTWIRDRVSFISDVQAIPGEFEMEAMRNGALRVLEKEEELHYFNY